MFNFFKVFEDNCVIMFHDDKMYVSAGKIRDGIVRHANLPRGLTKSDSLFDVVEHFGVDYKFFNRNRTNPTAVDISVDTYRRNHRSYQIGISFSSITSTTAISTLVQRAWPKYATIVEDAVMPALDDSDELAEKADVVLVDGVDEDDMLYLNNTPCPIITLEDHDQFMDNRGNVLPIEFRGERAVDRLLIKAKDVACAFDLGSQFVRKMLLRNSYYKDEDYVILSRHPQEAPATDVVSAVRSSYGTNRLTYFTVDGIEALLDGNTKARASRKSIKEFVQMARRWANSMYPLEEYSAPRTAWIYLIKIGSMREIHGELMDRVDPDSARDEAIGIYKFGRTCRAISDRFEEHRLTYGKYARDIKVEYTSPISRDYIIQAEDLLKEYFTETRSRFAFTDSDNRGHNELVLLHDIDLATVCAEYDRIDAQYAHHAELDKRSHAACQFRMENAAERIEAMCKHGHENQLAEITHKYEQEQALDKIEQIKLNARLAESDSRLEEMALKHQLDIKDIEHEKQLEIKEKQFITEQFESFKREAALRDELHQLKLDAALRK
jgi:hypothetical protein